MEAQHLHRYRPRAYLLNPMILQQEVQGPFLYDTKQESDVPTKADG